MHNFVQNMKNNMQVVDFLLYLTTFKLDKDEKDIYTYASLHHIRCTDTESSE